MTRQLLNTTVGLSALAAVLMTAPAQAQPAPAPTPAVQPAPAPVLPSGGGVVIIIIAPGQAPAVSTQPGVNGRAADDFANMLKQLSARVELLEKLHADAMKRQQEIDKKLDLIMSKLERSK